MYFVSCFFKDYPSVAGNAFGPFNTEYEAKQFVKEKEEKQPNNEAIWVVSEFTQAYVQNPIWSEKSSDAFPNFTYKNHDE